MIDPSMDTLSAPSDMAEDYKAKIADLLTISEDYKTKIADLENKLSLKTQSWEFASSQLQRRVAQIESFENELKNNPWDFDNETLSDLASYFDITLEREYSVEITVRFSGNVTVPMDYDIDDLENELSAEISKSYYSNSSVEIDFMEEDMEISYEEV